MQCWHRLALELKGRTVEELQDAMSYTEFQDWNNYFELRPHGPEWDDVRIAVLSANIVSALTGKAQKVEDHKAKYKKPIKKMSGKQVGMFMREMVAEAQRKWQTPPTSAK